MIYEDDIKIAKAQIKVNKKLINKLKGLPDKQLDNLFYELHDEVFNEVDCLSCANCCKTTSPIFRNVDIKRISKVLKLSPSSFIDKYLYKDNDGDFVLLSSPCSFLNEDNTCSIYEFRPLACREYPHTNRKKMRQILSLTRKNSEICPAVSRIFVSLRK
jgi:Fe-S-cluster containining protein